MTNTYLNVHSSNLYDDAQAIGPRRGATVAAAMGARRKAKAPPPPVPPPNMPMAPPVTPTPNSSELYDDVANFGRKKSSSSTSSSSSSSSRFVHFIQFWLNILKKDLGIHNLVK